MSAGAPVTVMLNGEPRSLDPGATLSTVVAQLSRADSGIAVALNGSVVPRSAWAGTELAEADQVEVLTAVQGG